MGRPCINLTGQKFGRLTVLNQDILLKKASLNWMCKCECGTIKSIDGWNLRSGKTLSCGCLQLERAKEANTKHGDRYTAFFQCWLNIKQRCFYESSKDYQNYGGRGITICDRWLVYENFKKDMYDSYLEHLNKFGKNNTFIERSNNDGNYEISNCKWATKKEQIHNRRTLKSQKVFEAEYIIPGESFGYKEISNNQNDFARKYNIGRSNISNCLTGKLKTYKGWKFNYIQQGETL